LGSQNPQDNSTWGFNRVSLPSSPIAAGQNATFTFTAAAPMTAGVYAFSWRMVQDGVQWFGDTFTAYITVVMPGPGTNYGSYTLDTVMDSNSRSGSYVAYTTCGVPAWYSYGVPGNSNCTVFNRDIRWMPTFTPYGFTGRGFLAASMLVPSSSATATVNFFAVDNGGTDLPGPITGSINECAYSCTSPTFFSGGVNVPSLGGWRSNTQNDGVPGAGGCNAACGTFPAGYSQMHIQAARWQYIDDWVCLGGYASTNVSDTSNRSFNEANLYLYPALDTSHGNVLGTALGLNGKTPGRVTTGDCNNSNSLDFKGNANAFGGGDNMDSYGFGWLFAPAGASPQFLIGSDDGNRLWINGTLKNSINASRGLTRDQDNTGAVSLPAGWSRVLFKVHNITGSFQGTVTLRNGSNANLNEPSVNYFDLGGYYTYGVGHEQDGWYPQIVVNSVNGVVNPVNGAAFYGNTTTFTATGLSSGQGPVPYWRTMQYQWGYGLGNADSNYADVSGAPTATNWSHATTGVTGHRRFHFFAVSQSGRTSFQNSGLSGGSIFQDTGNYARYFDTYVDNVAPQNPAFSSLVPDTNQISLAWGIPLDQGVNITPGDTESAGGAGNLDSQNWYRVGDVGVQAYRNGSVLSGWSTATGFNDTGLVPNTPYTYALEARDNNSGARGVWHNSTSQQGGTTAWTLSIPPGPGTIVPSQTNAAPGTTINWTAIGGFGPGQVQYYRYAWDQSPNHTFTDTEAQWTTGSLSKVPTSTGLWYLHVKGYNGVDVGNGAYDYVSSVFQPQPQILSISINNGDVTITWSSVNGSTYRVQYTSDFDTVAWTSLSPDIPATGPTASITDHTGGAAQRFYRVLLLP
jgi:hypothetical protein